MGTSENIIKTFEKLEIDSESIVKFTYSEGVDVMHYRGEAEETAVNETETIDVLVNAFFYSGISFNENLVTEARDQGHLEDYERGDFVFEDHVREKVVENFYDYYDYVDCSTEQYDHKRGFTTVTATLTATAQSVLDAATEGSLNTMSGWQLDFDSSLGSMSIEL